MSVDIKQFGKDHWSLFAYAVTRAVDYKGVLDYKHMSSKINPPLGVLSKPKPRLFGYFEDKSLCIEDYDDFDCLDDLEAAGLLLNIGTGLNPIVKITENGWGVSTALNQHKASGEMFASFVAPDDLIGGSSNALAGVGALLEAASQIIQLEAKVRILTKTIMKTYDDRSLGVYLKVDDPSQEKPCGIVVTVDDAGVIAYLSDEDLKDGTRIPRPEALERKVLH